MVIITNLTGESLPLRDIDALSRTRGTNGDYQIKMIAHKTERNKEAFDLITEESIITLPDGNKFRVKSREKNTVDKTVRLEVIALHTLYDNVSNYQYDIIKGEKVLSLHQALKHAFTGTNITFYIEDEFENYSFENFGDDNSIALFNKIKESYEFEFVIENNTHLRIYKRLGKVADTQLRYKHNIKTIKLEDNTHNLSTYIKGYGKPQEDEEGNVIEGEYVVATDYTSPNADKYGILHATPYYNEKITHKETLLRYLKARLIDEPEMMLTVEHQQLINNLSKQLDEIELGDTLYLIHEPLDIQFNIRINEVIDFPLHPQIKPVYTLSTNPISLIDNNTLPHVNKNNSDKEISTIKNNQSDFNKRIEKTIEAVTDVENKMIHVNNEMERIQNEVIPEVEQAIDETKIPSQVEPPYPIPISKLWWDTSINPPRLKQWDGNDWLPLASTQDEIDALMQQMRDEAVTQSKTYSDAEIQAARQYLTNRLDNEIGDVQSDIDNLQDTATNLINRANNADKRLDDTEQALSLKLDNLTYQNDKTDILLNIERNETNISLLSDEINLRVTRDEYNTGINGIGDRITSTESSITQISDAISLKADRSELTNYVDKQTYTNKMASLDVSINGINGKVTNIESDINSLDNQMTSALSQIAQVDIKADGISSSVSELRGEFDDVEARLSLSETSITQLSNQISLKASQTSVDNLMGRMSAAESEINLMPDKISLAVKDGIDNIEIGGRNLVSNSAFQTGDKTGWETSGTSYRFVEDGLFSNFAIEIYSTEGNTVHIIPTGVLRKGVYTIQIWYKHLEGDVPFLETNGEFGRDLDAFKPGVGWRKLEFKKEIVNSSPFFKIRYASTSPVGYVEGRTLIGAVKVEKGNKATDWSLAEEDQVNKTNVLSSINLSPEGIKIQGNKIDIVGLVSVLNADGTPGTMINGNKLITGSVTANKLNINEVFGNSAVIAKIQSDSVLTANLNATKITTGTLNAANVSIINLSASNISTGYLNAARIASKSIDASKINVDSLSAISANLGTVKSGRLETVELIGATGDFSGEVHAGRLTVSTKDIHEVPRILFDGSRSKQSNIRWNANADYDWGFYITHEDTDVVIINKNNGLTILKGRLNVDGVRANIDNLYLRPVANNEVRVANESGAYRPIRASAFNQSSSIEYKTNIENVSDIGLDVINNLTVLKYDLKTDIENGVTDNRQIGFIAEYSDDISSQDRSAIDIYKLSAYQTKAIQELSKENDDLKQRLNVVEQQLEQLLA